MSALRILIVDDEPLAQRRLRTLLRDIEGVEVVGAAGDGQSALRQMRACEPDVVLLDVKMPGLNGLELLEGLGERPPAVIFVTAFSEFAIDAFDLAATDYLLKPVEPERLKLALDRAREALEARGSAERIAEFQTVLAQLRQAGGAPRGAPRPREIWVSNRNERIAVPVAEIDWVKAERDYVRLYTGASSHLLREPIEALSRRLDPRLFLRVHRSAIVRADRIRKVRREKGRLVLALSTGAEVPVSRARSAAVQALIAEARREDEDRSS